MHCMKVKAWLCARDFNAICSLKEELHKEGSHTIPPFCQPPNPTRADARTMADARLRVL
jgi:hypothetical protein